MKDIARFSEKLTHLYLTLRRHSPEDKNQYSDGCENLIIKFFATRFDH